MPNNDPMTRHLYLLPWLRLASEVNLVKARAIPVDVKALDRTLPELADVSDEVRQVLSSFRRSGDHPITRCAVLRQEGWDSIGTPVGDSASECRRLADLLMLAAFAKNGYCTENGSYVNSRAFELFTVQFAPTLGPFSLDYRRRGSGMRVFNVQFGQGLFRVPPEAEMHSAALVDHEFARALGSLAAKSDLARRLDLALPLFGLANTDSIAIPEGAEIVMLAGAYDAALDTDGSQKVANEVTRLLAPFAPAAGVASPRARLKARCHQWAREFYEVRSQLAHTGDDPKKATRKRQRWEHLLMGSFVFPLLVKLLLSRDHGYQLTWEDKAKCYAVDMLLGENDWISEHVHHDDELEQTTSIWADVLRQAERDWSSRETEEIAAKLDQDE